LNFEKQSKTEKRCVQKFQNKTFNLTGVELKFLYASLFCFTSFFFLNLISLREGDSNISVDAHVGRHQADIAPLALNMDWDWIENSSDIPGRFSIGLRHGISLKVLAFFQSKICG
jgi:hypothetical protein